MLRWRVNPEEAPGSDLPTETSIRGKKRLRLIRMSESHEKKLPLTTEFLSN